MEVVNIRYVNPRAFKFTGRIRLPDGKLMNFSADSIEEEEQHLKWSSSWLAGDICFNFTGPPRK